MATSNSSNAKSTLLANNVQATKAGFSSGVFVGIADGGDCIVEGFGELDTRQTDLVAMKLCLMAGRLRAAARREAATMCV